MKEIASYNMREDKDMTQAQMAAYLKIHQTTYSDYELGNVNIPIQVLIKFTDLFGTSIDYLVDRTDEKKPYLSIIKVRIFMFTCKQAAKRLSSSSVTTKRIRWIENSYLITMCICLLSSIIFMREYAIYMQSPQIWTVI